MNGLNSVLEQIKMGIMTVDPVTDKSSWPEWAKQASSESSLSDVIKQNPELNLPLNLVVPPINRMNEIPTLATTQGSELNQTPLSLDPQDLTSVVSLSGQTLI